jgi:plastocyanin
VPRSRPWLIATLPLVVAAAGCGGGGTRPAATPAPAGVDIRLYAFTPSSVTVGVGQAVTWTQRDTDLEGQGAHSVVADDKAFDSGLVKDGTTFTFTPARSGTIAYHCGVHNYMTGTITVR